MNEKYHLMINVNRKQTGRKAVCMDEPSPRPMENSGLDGSQFQNLVLKNEINRRCRRRFQCYLGQNDMNPL